MDKSTLKTSAKQRWPQSMLGLCVASALIFGAIGHVSAEPQLSDWRAANDAVAKFLRGHIDIVRAEAKSGASASLTNQKPVNNPTTLIDAKRQALKARAVELFEPLGLSAMDRQRHAVKVTELLFEVEQSWLKAVGAHVMLGLQENATEAALIAQELAARMGVIGNWGNDRVLAVQLQAKAEQIKLMQARQEARQSLLALEGLLMQTGIELPDSLPDIRGLGARADLRASVEQLANERLQRQPNYAASLLNQQRLEELAGGNALTQWRDYVDQQVKAFLASGNPGELLIDPSRVLWNHNVKEALESRSTNAQLQAQTKNTIAVAQAAVKNSHEQAMLLVNEVVPLAKQAEEEAVYQYNGMFISTWSLLQQYRSRVDAEIAAVGAQLLFLQTDAAFKAYMAGLQYRPPVGSVATNPGANDAGGH